MIADEIILDFIKRGHITIAPTPNDESFQPCTVDLTLGSKILIYRCNNIIPFNSKNYIEVDIKDNLYNLTPGEFVLGMTEEQISLSNFVSANINGKSTLGRLGLLVHATAGFVDPGWNGNLTLELKNLSSNYIIKLKYGMKIAQISFDLIYGQVKRPYKSNGLSSHYQGDGLEKPNIDGIYDKNCGG